MTLKCCRYYHDINNEKFGCGNYYVKNKNKDIEVIEKIECGLCKYYKKSSKFLEYKTKEGTIEAVSWFKDGGDHTI